MKLIIKNKFGSIGGGSTITNEQGEKVFIVKGSWGSNTFSKKYKKRIYSLDKKKLFIVCNKRIHKIGKRSCLIYDGNKRQVAAIEQTNLIKNGFTIFGTTEKMEAVMVNKMLGFPLDIKVGDKKIGQIGVPPKLNLMDTFYVEFEDKEDAAFLSAIVIAIDNILDADQRKARKK